MLKRKIIFLLVLIIVFTSVFSGCAAREEKLSFDVVLSYIKSCTAMDFSSAYDCLWKYGGRPKRDEFTGAYKNLIDSLKITSVSFTEPKYEKISDTEYTFTTDATYKTSYAGDLSVTVSANIVKEHNGIYIQYNDSIILPDYVYGDKISYVTVQGERGEILTSDRVVIAENNYADTVYLTVPSTTSPNESIAKLKTLLSLTDEEAVKAKKAFDSAAEKNYGTVTVKSYPKGTIDDTTEAAVKKITGAGVDRSSLTPQRYYPYPGIYSHVTGYVGTQSDEELAASRKNGWSETAAVGKAGVEKSRNDVLMGHDGYSINIYASDGQYKSTLASKSAVRGSDVILTIDSKLQNLAYYLIEEKMTDEQTGVAIVMDPSTGAVESLVNCPSYDSNKFSGSVTQEELNNMPLFSNATQGLYPPGSLLKPFTAVPALEDGTATMSTVFPYASQIKDNKWTPTTEAWPWEPISRDEKTIGEMNMTNCIKSSDNIYFGWLALQMGADRFTSFMKTIGIGEKMSFETATSKSNLINSDTKMDRKLLTDMSFGQGQILLTPIQIASMYSAFSTGGSMISPNLVSEVFSDDGGFSGKAKTTYFKKDVIPSSIIDTLMPALRDVIASGTAASIKIDGFSLAGKTGTALKGNDKTKESSWVVAWYDNMDQKKLVLVLIDGPRTQGKFKFDVARKLLKAAYDGTTTISDATSTPGEPG